MSIALLKSILLNKRNKNLYIIYMAFSTFFSISTILFNSFRKQIIKLTNYYYYLI